MLTGHDTSSALRHGRLILLTGRDTSTALNRGHLLSVTRNCVVCLKFFPPQLKCITFKCETEDKLIPELSYCRSPDVSTSVPFRSVLKLCNFGSWSNTLEKVLAEPPDFTIT